MVIQFWPEDAVARAQIDTGGAITLATLSTTVFYGPALQPMRLTMMLLLKQ